MAASSAAPQQNAAANRRRAVVFDLGGVVLGSPLAGIAEYEARTGVPTGFVNVAIVARGKAGAFQRLERGELGLKDFYREFREELARPENVDRYVAYLQRKGRKVPANLPESFDIDTETLFGYMMEKAATIDPHMCHALFVLRGLGFTVAALTNNWQLDSNSGDSSNTDKLRAYFDDIIESSVVGLRKPDKRLYQLACDRLGVAPAEVAFLDDIGLNLKSAREFGWSTVQVTIGKTAEALRELARIIDVDPKVLVPDPAQVSEEPVKLRFPVGAAGGTMVMDLYGWAYNPLIMFLHGGGQTRHSWDRTAQTFAERGYCAITVDMKGHGESYWDDRAGISSLDRYLVPGFATDLEALGVALKLEQRLNGFALVGASLGGLSILTTQSLKDKARALVLVDITPRMELKGVKRITSWMRETSKSGFASLEDAAEAVASYNPRADRGPQTPASLDGLRKNLRQRADGRWIWHYDPNFVHDQEILERDLALAERRILEHASGTTTPCLLVRGRETDLVSEEGAQAFVQAMPNARYVNVDHAAHMVAGDRNDVFAIETLTFLQQHLSAGAPPPPPRAPSAARL